MTKQLNTPFHQHLNDCEQCKTGNGKLCKQGESLLANRRYDMPKKSNTEFCYTCNQVKPTDQFEVRKVTREDGKKNGVKRCTDCWERRTK